MEDRTALDYESPRLEIIGSVEALTLECTTKPFGPTDNYLAGTTISNASPVPCDN